MRILFKWWLYSLTISKEKVQNISLPQIISSSNTHLTNYLWSRFQLLQSSHGRLASLSLDEREISRLSKLRGAAAAALIVCATRVTVKAKQYWAEMCIVYRANKPFPCITRVGEKGFFLGRLLFSEKSGGSARGYVVDEYGRVHMGCWVLARGAFMAHYKF